jgi:branched-chain amino acid transport system permease protein
MVVSEPGLAADTATAGGERRRRALDFMQQRHRFRLAEALPWVFVIGAFFVFPDRMTFGTQVLIMALFALSLDLILGYAGIVTLGHAAFFGTGAYTVGLLSVKLGWNEPITGILAGGAVAAVLGLASGWFLLRYRGLTLLMLTLATAILLQEFGNFRADITGGYDGLPGMVTDPLFGTFDYDLYGHTYYLYCAAVLFVATMIVRRIVYSPFGAALTGIRENVRRMHAIGSPVHWRLVLVYGISAGIAGVAGGLFAQSNGLVTLATLGFETSASVLVMLILGGPGRLYGGIIGAVVYMVIYDYLSKVSPSFWQFGIGLLLVITVLFARRGLLGLGATLSTRLRPR